MYLGGWIVGVFRLFPKRGQVWTYRERTRLVTLVWALPLLGGIGFGIYLVLARGEWLVLICSVIGIIAIGVVLLESERHRRGEP